MWENRNKFDLVDSPHESDYYNPTNSKEIIQFKDETSDKCIIEFVGLRLILYSFIVVNGESVTGADRHIGETTSTATSGKDSRQGHIARSNQESETYRLSPTSAGVHSRV